MNDLDRMISEEIDDEALFALADGAGHEFSPKYQKEMAALYRKARAHPKRLMKPIRRVIAIAAVIAILTSSVTVAAFWEDIGRFFAASFGEYVELSTVPVESRKEDFFKEVPEEWGNFWYPDSLKEGYRFDRAEAKGTRKIIVFSGVDGGELYFFQWMDDEVLRLDQEGEICEGIYVGTYEAYAIEKEILGETQRSIYWVNEDISFELQGNLTFEELCDIAESLILIER